MSIPANPTVSDIVTEALKRGGRTNPSASDITNFSAGQFQEVKSDIYLAAPQHHTLETTDCIPVVAYQSRYDWPTECEAIKAVQLIESTTEGSWIGTAQAGGASSITLASAFSQDSVEVQGRMLYIVAGTGSGQFAQITSYNNSTKVATIEAAWTTLLSTWVTPDATSVYLIERKRTHIFSYDKPLEWDTIASPNLLTAATHAAMVGRQIWLNTTPDRYYALHITFWYALDQLDEDSTLFRNHLRKMKSLWIQGLTVKVMQRYDEDRYPTELQVYQRYLQLYGSTSSHVGQVQFRDV